MPTCGRKSRSIAYFTSAEVASRFTGGQNLTPFFSLTVTVLPSGEAVGYDSAKSGEAFVVSSGLFPSTARCVEFV